MEKDPHDEYNIVRLEDEFYFRDHHCFVFEILETDLFEYMKENDFAGFSLSRIKNIAA
jgi:dual specificity tyrosine-phosphorylation-regulated kinase 2/3/4